MNLRALVSTYLDHLRVERGLSANTLDAYARDLGALVAHVGDVGLDEVTGDALCAFMSSEARRGLSAASAARRTSTVRGFCRFLLREGAVAVDPSRLLESPKVARALPRSVSTSDVERLLESASVEHAGMVAVLFACGLRASELVNLDTEDLDDVRGLVLVRNGKGGKSRLVPIAPRALALVREYAVSVRRRHAMPEERALFVSSRTGRRYRRRSVHAMVRAVARRAGLEGVHPHQLRHAFALALLRGGANLRAIQALMGHADLGSTAIYLQLDVEDVRRAHRLAHPRG